jgi:hypothetical protein
VQLILQMDGFFSGKGELLTHVEGRLVMGDAKNKQ